MTASFDNGVLEITMHTPLRRPTARNIEATGGSTASSGTGTAGTAAQPNTRYPHATGGREREDTSDGPTFSRGSTQPASISSFSLFVSAPEGAKLAPRR